MRDTQNHLLIVQLYGMWLQGKLVRLSAGLLGKDCHVSQVRQVELLVQQAPLDEMITHIPQVHMNLQLPSHAKAM